MAQGVLSSARVGLGSSRVLPTGSFHFEPGLSEHPLGLRVTTGTTLNEASQTPSFERWVFAALTACVVLSAYMVYRNATAFDISAVRYSKTYTKRWKTDAKKFRDINLPFMRPGLFQVDFVSDRSEITLDVYAQDCLMEVFLDGKRIQDRLKKCRYCYTYHPVPRHRCKTKPVQLKVTPGKTHRLAIHTKLGKKNPRPRAFFLEYEHSAFGWRLLGFFSLALLVFGVFRVLIRGVGSFAECLDSTGRFVYENRAFVFLVLCAIAARIIMAPVHQSGDIYQSALMYAEDFFHKSGWDYAQLSSDYTSAKYDGESHMHKPPGLYYQFVLLRWVFSFGYIFYIYLTAVPSLVGDLLIATVLYSVFTRYASKGAAQAIVVLYLMSAGIFLASAIVNRVDCIPIALLALAVLNQGRRRFIVYLGLAVASKQIALFAVPWFFFDGKTTKKTLLAGLVTLAACLPYLLDDPQLFAQRLALPQLNKEANGMTWVFSLHYLGFDVESIAKVLTRSIPLVVLVLPLLVTADKWVGVTLSYLTFILLVKNVHEHYIMWSTIPLIITYLKHRRVLCLGAALFGILSMTQQSDRGVYIAGSTVHMYSVVLGLVYFAAFVDLMTKFWGPSRPFKRSSDEDSTLRVNEVAP